VTANAAAADMLAVPQRPGRLASGSVGAERKSLLLVLPLVATSRDGRIHVDQQAANGFGQWLANFPTATAVLKLGRGAPPPGSVAIDSLRLAHRLHVVAMPTAWSPLAYLRARAGMRRMLADLIDRHDYLHFAIGGAWGDWAAEAALIAARRGRRYAVWTDRVESQVMRLDAERAGGLKRLYRGLNARLAARLERRVIARASVGLFHGNDTYSAYAGYCREPHLVHNIHLKADDRIGAEALAAKRGRAAQPGPLTVIYVGRVHADKGVDHWIEALRTAIVAGADIRARWIGDGPLRGEAIARVAALGLSDRIAFPGSIADHAEVLAQLRAADALVFCHLTPESPRNLIEALASGTPIIGYESAYPRDLIAAHGGGVLTAMGPAALAAALVDLSRDRARLADLIGRAAADGWPMTDEAVFAHRSDLMKRYC